MYVTNYVARTACRLALEKEILAMPNPKLGKTLPGVTVQLVNSLFKYDEHSYFFFFLHLCNLKELFVTFKTKNPEIKKGFSRFCTLRPKCCIIVGASLTHSVCVCSIHQNLKLLLHPLGVVYKELFPYDVCNLNDKKCMM